MNILGDTSGWERNVRRGVPGPGARGRREHALHSHQRRLIQVPICHCDMNVFIVH